MANLKLYLKQSDNRAFINKLSSDNYSSMIESVLIPLDLLYTYLFRYDRVCEVDIAGDTQADTDNKSQGAMIDYTSSHHEIAILVTIGFACIALASLFNNYRNQAKKKQKEWKKRNSSFMIMQEMQIEQSSRNAYNKQNVEEFNNRIKKLLLNDNLKKKYKEITLCTDLITQETFFDIETVNEISPTLTRSQSRKKFVFNKIITPLWSLMCLTSFVFWILWIGSGIFTGSFGKGITNIPDPLVYICPLAVGFVYLAIKIKNWYVNRNRKPLPTPQQANDITELTNKVMLDWYKERLQALLDERGLSFGTDQNQSMKRIYTNEQQKNKIEELTTGIKMRLLMTGIASAFGTYIGIQYGLWVITDFLDNVCKIADFASLGLFQLIAGTTCIALAGITSLYSVFNAYFGEKGIKSQKKQVAALNTSKKTEEEKLIDANLEAEHKKEDLEKTLKEIKNEIKNLRLALGNSAQNIPADLLEAKIFQPTVIPPKTKWQRYKPFAIKVYHFINGACSGIFVARTFFVAKTAIALPFAAAAFSNPITIGILVGIGILYGCVKLYEHSKAEKIRKAKEILENLTENISCLQKQYQLAKMLKAILRYEKDKKEKSEPLIIEKSIEINLLPKAENILMKSEKPVRSLKSSLYQA